MVALVLAATVGNALGAIVNWALGRFLSHRKDRHWFPIKTHKLEKAEQHYRKYGRFSLLFSWVPLIGDPITVIAGVLREPLWFFILLVTITKCAQYTVIAIAAINTF